MKTSWFRIDLLEPVCLSAQSGTEGVNRSLDLIPGRTFLGIAAKHLYHRWLKQERNKQRIWDVFHSGQVRFGDGLPFFQEQLALPIPLSLHRSKDPDEFKTRLSSDEAAPLINQAAPDYDAAIPLYKNLQTNQQRQGYMQFVGSNGAQVRFKRHNLHTLNSTRTALEDDGSSRPREGMLFAFESLAPRQSFVAPLSADKTLAEEVFVALEKAICGEQTIGRTRNSEFGKVWIEKIDFTPPPSWTQSSSLQQAKQLSVYLLSDLCLLTDNGHKTFTPGPEVFGIPKAWELDLSRTFLRSRRYDRFNGFRCSFDLEREVLQRGSVLTFRGEQPLPQGFDSSGLRFAGQDTQEGLGAYLLAPSWLHVAHWNEAPSLSTSSPSGEQAVPQQELEDSYPGLLDYLKSREPLITDQIRSAIEEETKRLAAHCSQEGRQEPGPTGWSNLRNWLFQLRYDFEKMSTSEKYEVFSQHFGRISFSREYQYEGDKRTEQFVTGTQQTLVGGWEKPLSFKSNNDDLASHLLAFGEEYGHQALMELTKRVRESLRQNRKEERKDRV